MAKRLRIDDRTYYLTDDVEIPALAETIRAAMTAGEAFTYPVAGAAGQNPQIVVRAGALDVVELYNDTDARGQISL
jgi:hypothetical protein